MEKAVNTGKRGGTGNNSRPGVTLFQFLFDYFSLDRPSTRTPSDDGLLLQEIPSKAGLARSTCYRLVTSLFDDSVTITDLLTIFGGDEKGIAKIRGELELYEIPVPGKRARKVIRLKNVRDGEREEVSRQERTCGSCVFFNSRLRCSIIEWLLHGQENGSVDRRRVMKAALQELKNWSGRLAKKKSACKLYHWKGKSCPFRTLKRVNGNYKCPRPYCRGSVDRLPLPGHPVTCSKGDHETYFTFSTMTPYRTRVDAWSVFRKTVEKLTGIVLASPETGARTVLTVSGEEIRHDVKDDRMTYNLPLDDSQEPSLVFSGNIPHVVFHQRSKKRQVPLHEIAIITVREGSEIPEKFRESMKEFLAGNQGDRLLAPIRSVKWRVIPAAGVKITAGKKGLAEILENEDIRSAVTEQYYRALFRFLENFPAWWQAIMRMTGESEIGKKSTGRHGKQAAIAVDQARSDLQQVKELLEYQARKGRKAGFQTQEEAEKEQQDHEPGIKRKLRYQTQEMKLNNPFVLFLKKKAVELCSTANTFEEAGFELSYLETSQKRLRHVPAPYWGSIARAHDCYTCLVNGITWHVRRELMEINLERGLDPQLTRLFFHGPRKHERLGPHLDLEEYGRTFLQIHAVKALAEGRVEARMFSKHWDPRAGFYYRLHHVEIAESIARQVMGMLVKWKKGREERIGTFRKFHAGYVTNLVSELLRAVNKPEELDLRVFKPPVPVPVTSN